MNKVREFIGENPGVVVVIALAGSLGALIANGGFSPVNQKQESVGEVQPLDLYTEAATILVGAELRKVSLHMETPRLAGMPDPSENAAGRSHKPSSGLSKAEQKCLDQLITHPLASDGTCP
jgi:hypothetical protein